MTLADLSLKVGFVLFLVSLIVCVCAVLCCYLWLKSTLVDYWVMHY